MTTNTNAVNTQIVLIDHAALFELATVQNTAMDYFKRDALAMATANAHLKGHSDTWIQARTRYINSVKDSGAWEALRKCDNPVAVDTLQRYTRFVQNAFVAIINGLDKELIETSTLTQLSELGVKCLESCGKDGGRVKGYIVSNSRKGAKTPKAEQPKETKAEQPEVSEVPPEALKMAALIDEHKAEIADLRLRVSNAIESTAPDTKAKLLAERAELVALLAETLGFIPNTVLK